MPSKLKVIQRGDDFEVQRGDSIVYIVRKKIPSLMTNFRIEEENKIVGYIRRDEKNAYTYQVFDDDEAVLATITIRKLSTIQDVITLKIGEKEATSKDFSKGKSVDFKLDNNKLLFTIDKKLLKVKDAYTIDNFSNVDPRILVSTVVVFDELYHE